jgi:hypothetical protein
MHVRRRQMLVGALALAIAAPLGSAPVLTGTPGTTAQAVPAPAAAVIPPLTPEARAMGTARQTGRRVELLTQRTEVGELYVNPDGSKTMEQHALPVRVRRGTGWVAPDPTLRRQPDGSVRPVATVSPITLSGGGSTTLLTIGKPGARVTMGWPGTLPAPMLRADTATYPEVLPGVDLKIKVGVDNFSHLLVVKNRTAALNPALSSLRTLLRTDGLTLKVKPDGTTVAAGASGETVFTAGAPVMWDSSNTLADLPAARHSRVGIKLAASRVASYSKEFRLIPDRALLTDPAAKFPIYIDPSLSGNLIRWLHVNVRMGNQTGWGYDTTQGAKVGRAYQDTANLYRSMFQLSTVNGTNTIAGSTVSAATFRITLDHSPTGTPTPVELWHLQDLDPAAYLNWDTTAGHWRTNLATTSAKAYPPPEDRLVEFSSVALTNVVQAVADVRTPSISLGLRAPDESTSAVAQNQWKKFFPSTAVLSITYNNTPRMPKSLNFTRPKPCGTAQSPVPINTRMPQFSAVANDPDTGDSVTTTLQIFDPGNVMKYESKVGPTVSGAAFSWPQVPDATLADNVVYHYRAFTADQLVSGPATPDCYFIVDSVRPPVPDIESTDFPDGASMIAARTTGTVSFKPAAGVVSDVAEYVYGFAAERTTMRVKAGPDGRATVPITVWPDPVSGVPSKRLYVRAVDKAGNVSLTRRAWDLLANSNAAAVTHVRGDSNGDGRADVTALFDQGFGRTAVWNVTSAGTGFHPGVIGWDTGEGAGFALYRIRPVQGDFDGDGKTDLAIFREDSGRQIWLYKLVSDGNRYDAMPASWTSGPNGKPLNITRTMAGDVDGDGRSDIVVQNPGAADDWEASVFTAAGGFAQPISWAKSGTGNPWTGSAPLLADIDGDHKADLVSMRNLGGCRTVVDFYKSTGTSFAAPTQIYDSGAGNYCWENSKPVVADTDGDGRDDIVALYQYGAGDAGMTDAGLTVFHSTGTALTQSSWWRSRTDFDLSRTTLSAGDFNGDGKEDAAIVYACCQTGARQVFTFASSGSTFGAKTQGWDGQVDAVTGPKFDLEHRSYDLVSRNSGKCLNVEYASTADLARYVQYQCLPVDLNARFRVESVAGTDQYSIRPMHSMKCADVDNWSIADGAQLLQWPCGGGNGEPTANQQVTIDYVDGSAYDTVVQLRFAHSGKCATVTGATANDNAPVQQQTCGQLTTQQWILRPSYNATKLGEGGTARYRVEAATSPDRVLDVTNCQKQDGGDIRMWDWVPGSPCQGWKLESLGDDVYKIINPDTGKAVDIDGCSKLPRGTIHMWTSNDSECQKWRIEPSRNGTYSVTAVSSGLSLDVAGCSPAAGADVISWLFTGEICQQWIFRKL